MIKNRETPFSEYVLGKHITEKIMPKVSPNSRKGILLRCIIRSNYIYPESDLKGAQRTENYLIKSTIDRRIKEFELLSEPLQLDVTRIISNTLFNAYRNEDRMRMIDFIIREARHPDFDPRKPFSESMNYQLENLKSPLSRKLKSLELKHKDQKTGKINRIFPHKNIGDIKDNIGRATNSYIEALLFIKIFSKNFPSYFTREETELFSSYLISIIKTIKKIDNDRDKKRSQNWIDAFYYLIKLAVIKHKKLSVEGAKEEVVKLAELLSLKSLSVDSLSRNFARGKKFVNSLPEISKARELEKHLRD